MAIRLRSSGQKILGEVTFVAKTSFSPGLLPNMREVLEVMLFHLLPSPGRKQMNKGEAAGVVADGLREHWIFQNIYTIQKLRIRKKVTDLHDEFTALSHTSQKKRTPVWISNKLQPFLIKIEGGLDILCRDQSALKKQEKFHGVKMTEEETKFVEDQLGPRQMFCTTAVDRAWAKTAERRRKDEETLRRHEETEKKEKKEREMMCEVPEDEDTPDHENNCDDEDFSLAEKIKECGKKGKRTFEEVLATKTDSLPPSWNHIRISHHKVRPEFYRVVDVLVCKYHCSVDQAVAAVVEVGRGLFSLPWMYHEEGDTITLDTAPHKQSQYLASKAIEAHTLSKIAQKMVEAPGNATVTLHDDGSRAQGCGGYSVSGVTLPGKEPGTTTYYPFPTLPIAKETRENLANLKLTILSMLATCGGVTRQCLWSKVDFVMTDSVSHNRGVEEVVAAALDVDHLPAHLLCNVHPSLMFGRQVLKLFVEIDSTLTPEKIYAGFAITVTDEQISVFQNCVDCTLRLISRDFNHKAWNKAEEFEMFLAPQRFTIKRLQMERFNSLVFSAATFLLVDPKVTEFLAKYEHNTNQLACLVRSFQTLDYIRVLAAVVVALGSHLILPYISLTSSSTTTQDKLMVAFPTLYTDLTTVDPKELLILDKPAFKFISAERFKQTNFPEDLLVPARLVLTENKQLATQVIKLLLPRLAKGWEKQRGNEYSFGVKPDLSAKDRVAAMDQDKLKLAPVNNLDPERSVGFINHERSVRGATQLSAASRAHVSGKGAELIAGEVTDGRFRKLSGPDGDMTKLMVDWKQKQEELAAEGLDAKTVASLGIDRQRNNDLATLKSMGGPFTTAADVEAFLGDGGSEADRNKRLYIEVGL